MFHFNEKELISNFTDKKVSPKRKRSSSTPLSLLSPFVAKQKLNSAGNNLQHLHVRDWV